MVKPSTPSTLALGIGLLLALAHLGLAIAQRPAARTVVLTPFVYAEGPPLSQAEGQALVARPGAADARDIAGGYATLGSTLSLAELLAGVEALSGPQALDAGQQASLAQTLSAAREDHAELVEVQEQILDLEAAIAGRVQRIEARHGGAAGPAAPAAPPAGALSPPQPGVGPHPARVQPGSATDAPR